jgi:hypothetical protein
VWCGDRDGLTLLMGFRGDHPRPLIPRGAFRSPPDYIRSSFPTTEAYSSSESMDLFYRVNYSTEHLRDWAEGRRTSFHHATDGDWMRIWTSTGSSSENDYPLCTPTAVYTPGAREHFLKTAKRENTVTGWDRSDVKLASELAGICAFDSPEALVAWFTETRFPSQVVEFRGRYVCAAPDGDGAVVAQVNEVLRIWTQYSAFRSSFGI